MFNCCKIFTKTYFEDYLCTSELSIPKPSLLGNIIKIPVTFKHKALNTINRKCYLYIYPLRFLLNLGSVCLPLTAITQKANACSPWTPCLHYCYFNINSVRNNFTNLKTIINENADILSIAEIKLHSIFQSAQFTLEGYCTLYRLDINKKSGGILVYI